ncbi:hypothetical protein KAJ27_22340 [bacterium]|nr:hypothetical protein [bacterium]
MIPSIRIKNTLKKGLNSIFCDGNDLWLGTNQGIVKFDGKNWLHYYGDDHSFIDGKPVQNKGNSPFKDNHVNNILKSEKKIFFLTDFGIIEYNSENFKFVHHTGSLKHSLYLNEAIMLDPNTILLGTWGKGLALFKTDTSTFKPAEPNIPGKVTYVTGITSNLKTIWISTLTNGIYSSNSNEDRFFSYTTKNSKLESNRSKGITSFNNDIFLITSNGLLRLTPKDFIWYYFKKQNSSLTNENITCLCIGENGLMYIGTLKGLYSYSKSGLLIKVANREIDNTWISNLAASKDSLWITTKQGELYKMDLSGK